MRDYVRRVSQMLPKLSDEQVKKVLDSIATENEMLDSILESLSTGLIVVNRAWKILKVNKIAERYLSYLYNLDDAKTVNLPLWELINEKESEIADFLKNCANEEKTNVSEEFSVVDSSGGVRFIQISLFSLITKCELKGNIIKIYDITEKRKNEIRLRRMENMAGLTNLAAGMAHEIKNPLGAISIHIQLLQKAINKKREGDGMLPEKRFLEENLDVVNSEIDRLNKLVVDFLFAVRPVKAELELLHPEKILKNIVNFFAIEFNKDDVEFVLETKSEKIPRLMLDEKLFREAIINMIQNSFAAIKERKSEIDGYKKNENGRICVKIYVKNDKVLIEIEDNGSGMSEETVSRLFEPYFTTKANGTGLGMTMVYKIVKEFSGEIQVDSLKGKGSTFKIVLPIPQTQTHLLENKQ